MANLGKESVILLDALPGPEGRVGGALEIGCVFNGADNLVWEFCVSAKLVRECGNAVGTCRYGR